jgi:hypothetical protein
VKTNLPTLVSPFPSADSDRAIPMPESGQPECGQANADPKTDESARIHLAGGSDEWYEMDGWWIPGVAMEMAVSPAAERETPRPR